MLSTILLGGFLVSLIHWLYIKINYKWASQFEGPIVRPIIGNAYAFLTNPLKFGDILSNYFKAYGHTFKLFVFNTPTLITTDPELIKILMTSHLTKHNSYKYVKFLGGPTGLVSSSGSQWHEDRKMLNKAFNVKHFETSLNAAVELSSDLINRISTCQKDIAFDPTSLLSKHILRILFKTWTPPHGESLRESFRKFEEVLERGLDLAEARNVRPWIMLPGVWKLLGYQKEFDYVHQHGKYLLGQFKQTDRTQGSSKVINKSDSHTSLDSLHDLLTNTGINPEWRIKQILTLVAAGTETSALTVTMTLFFLANNPECLKLAQEEVDLVFKETFHHKYEDLSRLQYLKMCVKETLRLHFPGANIGRTTTADIQLADGRKIPRGTGIIIYVNSLHKNPEYFPNPNEFQPERFSESKLHLIKPYTYIPFSKGPRNCIGQKMPEAVMPVTLAYILKEFTPSTSGKMEDLKVLPGILSLPYPPVNLVFHKRNL